MWWGYYETYEIKINISENLNKKKLLDISGCVSFEKRNIF